MAFIISMPTSTAALTLVGLPLAGLVGHAVRVRARRPAPVALPDIEVERSVRDRLYGERTIEAVRNR